MNKVSICIRIRIIIDLNRQIAKSESCLYQRNITQTKTYQDAIQILDALSNKAGIIIHINLPYV